MTPTATATETLEQPSPAVLDELWREIRVYLEAVALVREIERERSATIVARIQRYC
jgi:hypothetical protein